MRRLSAGALMLPKLTRVSLIVLGSVLIASAQSARPRHVKLSLISERASIAPGSSEWVGVRFLLEPGWHIYWTNPGDSGEPPKISWSLPAGVVAGPLQFPAPKRIADHGMVDYGYEGNAVLLSKLTIAKPFTSKEAALSVEVKYLVCREVCVPGRERLSLKLPVGGENRDTSEAGEGVAIRESKARLPEALPAGVQLLAESYASDFVITVRGQKTRLGVVTDFLPAEAQIVENSVKPKIEPDRDKTRLTLRKSEQLNHPIGELDGLLVTEKTAYNVVIPVTSAKRSSSRPTSSKDRSSQQP